MSSTNPDAAGAGGEPPVELEFLPLNGEPLYLTVTSELRAGADDEAPEISVPKLRDLLCATWAETQRQKAVSLEETETGSNTDDSPDPSLVSYYCDILLPGSADPLPLSKLTVDLNDLQDAPSVIFHRVQSMREDFVSGGRAALTALKYLDEATENQITRRARHEIRSLKRNLENSLKLRDLDDGSDSDSSAGSIDPAVQTDVS